MTRSYPEIICILVIGICGNYEYAVLDKVREILEMLLQSFHSSMTNGTKLSKMEMEME